MKKETAKKRITNAVNKACEGETQAVKDYIINLTMLTYEGLESDRGACHDDGTPYTSTENLKYAIAINLEDELGQVIDEARKETSKAQTQSIGGN